MTAARKLAQVRLGLGLAIVAATLVCGLLAPAEAPTRLTVHHDWPKTAGELA